MRIFELYFNPKDEVKISETFRYKPKNAYEGKLGSLYMVGEILKPEKTDASFLQNFFHSVKETYYEDTSLPPEKALKETLKKANSFLKERGSGKEISIALVVSKNFTVYLGKLGGVKTFLLTDKKEKDIGRELEGSASGGFYNMVSGKIKKEDKLIILTSEVYDFFEKESILKEIAQESLNETLIEKISSLQKEKFPNVSGVALVIEHAFCLKDKKTKTISKNRKERFSFRKMFLDTASSLKKVKLPLKIKVPRIKIRIPSIKIKKPAMEKKPLALLLLLLGVVFFGVLIIGIESRTRHEKQKAEITKIEEKFYQGEEEENISLMKEALLDLELLIKDGGRDREDLEERHSFLKEKLFSFSSGRKIEELNFVGEAENINPDKILFANGNIYLFSSFSPQIVIMDPETGKGTSHRLPVERGVAMASFSVDKIILFSFPDKVVFIQGEEISSFNIDLPAGEQKFIALSSFLGRPYFLDEEGNIILYMEKTPLAWIEESEEKIKEGVSISIDGSIFALSTEGEIYRYYKGKKEETLAPLLYPSLKTAKKIYTSPGIPLFLLDSKKKRVVVLNKEGEIAEQIMHESFKDLKDMSVSEDGKKIYLLLNRKVYSLEL